MDRYSLFDPAIVLFKMLSRQPLRGFADDAGVESLAGIMGGERSGCDENTTDVLIESALWNEINIAQTGRKLGINSDARYRFERGVDAEARQAYRC
jgi:phenylalanyl-tRNA synthetase beta subunit